MSWEMARWMPLTESRSAPSCLPGFDTPCCHTGRQSCGVQPVVANFPDLPPVSPPFAYRRHPRSPQLELTWIEISDRWEAGVKRNSTSRHQSQVGRYTPERLVAYTVCMLVTLAKAQELTKKIS